MSAVTCTVLGGLARLLEYPTAGLLGAAVRCREELAAESPDAAAELAPFVAWLANEPEGALEETHTRTFYLSPVCVPYVGVHIYGEESFQRGALMARLCEAFDERGFDSGPELPDHVAVLLRFAERLDPEERDDLVEYCLRGPVEHMAAQLARTANPYRHVLAALSRAVADVAGSRERSRTVQGAPL